MEMLRESKAREKKDGVERKACIVDRHQFFNTQIGVGYQHKTVVRQRTVEQPTGFGQRVVDMSVAAARGKKGKRRARQGGRESDGSSSSSSSSSSSDEEDDDGGGGDRRRRTRIGTRSTPERRGRRPRRRRSETRKARSPADGESEARARTRTKVVAPPTSANTERSESSGRAYRGGNAAAMATTAVMESGPRARRTRERPSALRSSRHHLLCPLRRKARRTGSAATTNPPPTPRLLLFRQESRRACRRRRRSPLGAAKVGCQPRPQKERGSPCSSSEI
ncbi:unnamed protein product [Ectocarpus sp. 12 AP-2014]